MAGLQRSSETFRRSGSSGLVWEDKHQSGELKPGPGKGGSAKEAPARLEQNRSSGHGGYKTGHVAPALDPPSPRVAVCGFCRLFGKGKAGAGGNGKANCKARRR